MRIERTPSAWTPLLAILLTASQATAGETFEVSFQLEGARHPVRHHRVDARLLVGSGDTCDVRLDGLAPEHAALRASEDGLVVEPRQGEVEVDGRVLEAPALLGPTQDILIGPYLVRFASTTSTSAGDSGLAFVGVDATEARVLEFEQDAYRFCHDEGFGEKGVVGAELCVLFDDGSARVCPAVEACDAWKSMDTPWVFSDGTRGTSRFDRRPREDTALFDLPALPTGLRNLFLVAALVAIAAFIVVALQRAGWRDASHGFAETALDGAPHDLQSLPEAPSKALLEVATRALEQQDDPRRAALILHIAFLRHLDDEGLVSFHPSRTNREYLRALRRQPALAKLFRAVVGQTERVRFGDGLVDPPSVRRALARTREVLQQSRDARLANRSTVALLFVACGLSACLPGPRTQAHQNYGPFGLSALAPILRETGLTVEVRTGAPMTIPREAGLLVLRTSAMGRSLWPAEVVLDRELDAGRNIILIDDLGRSSELFLRTASVAATSPPRATALELQTGSPRSSCRARLDGLREPDGNSRPRVPEGRLIAAGAEPLTSTVSAYTLEPRPLVLEGDRRNLNGMNTAYGWELVRSGAEAPAAPSGCLFLFANRGLFTNASLTRPENAAFVARLFAALTPPDEIVAFIEHTEQWTTAESDGWLPEDESPNPARTLEASNMLPFALQAMLFLAVLYLALGAAFGPLRDPQVMTHKAFVEHVEAIGQQYARLGKPGVTHSAVALARLFVSRHRDRLRGGESGGWSALADELAAKHGLLRAHVRAAIRLGLDGPSDLGAPRADDPPPSSPEMTRTLSRLLQTYSAGDRESEGPP